MRTTVTLDPDTAALIRQRMEERRVSFKVAVNDAIREGLGRRSRSGRFRQPTASMGLPAVNLDKALQFAAELEDDERLRKMRLGK